MNVHLAPGNYVIAVSGGVDSMVLLDMLGKQDGLSIVVAHFDHGVRPDSAEDELLVRMTAERRGLKFVSEKGRLGRVSEAVARTARYAFLRRVAMQHDARIVTAHHQDDVLETAILNLLRGSGRRGLTALKSTEEIVRPLLGIPKKQLLAYAREQNVTWREDSTNADSSYRRNYVRQRIVPQLGVAGRNRLLEIIVHLTEINHELDSYVSSLVQAKLDRRQFMQLPHSVSREVMAAWLRMHDLRSYDRRSLERLVVAVKTLAPGKRVDVVAYAQIIVGREYLALTHIDR